jgi:hypothetical protein
MMKLLTFRVHVIFVKEINDAMNRDGVTARSALHLRSYALQLSELTQAVRLDPDGAQAVNRWLPTAAARVRVRAACGVCDGQSSNGADFIFRVRVLWFILPNYSINFSIIIITRGLVQ